MSDQDDNDNEMSTDGEDARDSSEQSGIKGSTKKDIGLQYGGRNNESVETASSPSVVSPEVVKAAVEEGFIGALEKLDRAPNSAQGHLSLQSAHVDVFASPSGPPAPRQHRVSAMTVGCIICGQDGETIDVKGQQVPAEFFLCSKIGCRGKAHNEFLGFLLASMDEQGRPLPIDLQETVGEPSASTFQTAEKTKNSDKGKGAEKGKPAENGKPAEKGKAAEKSQAAAEPKRRGRLLKGGH
ncbi:unnamed protein product [Orchesella dallaii]|uniref:Uncharacterized protein n=1 Tax=Orchesella dallaii TaxID=48710 RepID=A0ABP1RP96_9HEXA